MSEIVTIDEELCTGCMTCIDMCPKGILYLDEDTNTCRVSDGNRCDRLRGCERACTANAIRVN